jgi:hypothetical protein
MMNHDKSANETVILAGAGGGYDIFGALPIYHKLVKFSKIILVNYSFTELDLVKKYAEEIMPYLYKISNNQNIILDNDDYFPEFKLAKELGNSSMYLFVDYPTCQSMINGYNKIIELEGNNNTIDAIYLVDGGCDILLKGTENCGLASFVEDMMHLKAVSYLKNINKKVVCAIGVNIDIAHGVTQLELDKRLDELKNQKILLDKWIFDKYDTAVKFYYDVFMKSDPQNSIVQSLICAAVDGFTECYTPTYLKSRIKENIVPLTVQTKTMHFFNLEELAKTIIYLDIIQLDDSADEVDKNVEIFLLEKYGIQI